MLGLALLLAGCGLYYYSKPGGSYTDFRTDSIACVRDFGIPSGNREYAVVSPNLYRRCMRDKGWARDQQVAPELSRYFRGVEDSEPVSLSAGPPQPDPPVSRRPATSGRGSGTNFGPR